MFGAILQPLQVLRVDDAGTAKAGQNQAVTARSGPDDAEVRKPRSPIVIVTGSCCIRGMALLDGRARQLVLQAVADSGVSAEVLVVPASAALAGALPRQVVAELIGTFNATGRVGLPAVVVDGEVVASGAVSLAEVTAALRRAGAGSGEEAQS